MATTIIARIAALATIALTATILIGTTTANAAVTPSYTYDHALRAWVHDALEQASYTQTHGKTIPWPIEVRCYTDNLSFELGAYRRGDSPAIIPTIIAYYAGGNTIHMRAGTCNNAAQFINGIYTAQSVGAFTTLLHESLHRQGFQNENLTEAFAIASMRAAGQFVQYVHYLNAGATDHAAAWQAAAATGNKVLRIAFEQSNRVVAANYRTTWAEVTSAERLGWAAWLHR